jgi:hypothetical protein
MWSHIIGKLSRICYQTYERGRHLNPSPIRREIDTWTCRAQLFDKLLATEAKPLRSVAHLGPSFH